MSRRVVAWALVWACVWIAAFARPGRAQDFEAPAPAWPPPGAHALIERGLPAADRAAALEGSVTRWHGLAALTTRSAAGTLGRGAARVGLGLSQTGEWDVGWTALAAAAGAAGPRAGAALRAVARRDRTTVFGFNARGAAVGCELGGGAWVEAAPGVHAWASAPQMWTRAAAPPLARPLEIGAAIDLGGLVLWLERAGVSGATRGARGERSAGVSTGAGPVGVWLAARDQPMRGSLGMSARVRGLEAMAQVESHPVLGETARVALRVGGAR